MLKIHLLWHSCRWIASFSNHELNRPQHTGSQIGIWIEMTLIAKKRFNYKFLQVAFQTLIICIWESPTCFVYHTKKNENTVMWSQKFDLHFNQLDVSVSVKPEIRFNTTIPSQFEWTNKPEQCNNALLNITCRGKCHLTVSNGNVLVML